MEIPSPLCMVDPDYIQHKLDDTTVLLPDVEDTFGGMRIVAFVEDRLGLKLTGAGWRTEGFLVAFASVEDAVLFRLAYDGETI